MRWKRLSSRIAASVPAPTANAVQLACPPSIASRDPPEVAQRTVAIDREAEELGQLADQHRERDAVHVAVADRLRQQLGDESQPQHPDSDAHQTRDHRHHARDGDRAHRVAARERQHDRENHGARARNPAPAPGSGSDRTARTRAAGRSWRTARRCRERPKPPHRRCRPAPASSSAPARPRDRAAARRLRSRAASAGPAANAASRTPRRLRRCAPGRRRPRHSPRSTAAPESDQYFSAMYLKRSVGSR